MERYLTELPPDAAAEMRALAMSALVSGEYKLPEHLKPSRMLYANPISVWGSWPNPNYPAQLAMGRMLWQKAINFARREKKIRTKRMENPSYCRKLSES